MLLTYMKLIYATFKKRFSSDQTVPASASSRGPSRGWPNKSSAVDEMGDRGHNRHGPKIGGLLCPFRGIWDPVWYNMCLGQGLPSYQAASASFQPFGHNRHGPKLGRGGCALFLGVAESTSNTMSRRSRSTSLPSDILIHAAVWPQ